MNSEKCDSGPLSGKRAGFIRRGLFAMLAAVLPPWRSRAEAVIDHRSVFFFAPAPRTVVTFTSGCRGD